MNVRDVQDNHHKFQTKWKSIRVLQMHPSRQIPIRNLVFADRICRISKYKYTNKMHMTKNKNIGIHKTNEVTEPRDSFGGQVNWTYVSGIKPNGKSATDFGDSV